MQDLDNPDYKLGQKLSLEGFRYTQIPAEVLALTGRNSVNATIYRGFDKTHSITRCGYSLAYWNKSGDKYIAY